MALGGGTFTVQNKILPGAYINFVSLGSVVSMGSRGVAALALELDWGMESAVFSVTSSDFNRIAIKIFAHDPTAEKLLLVREVLKRAKALLVYRVNSGGVKASKIIGGLTVTAKYCGTRGNDIRVATVANVDDSTKIDVVTYLDTAKVDHQTVSKTNGGTALKPNDYVTFSGTAITASAATALSGGTNGTVNGAAHSAALTAIEAESFNTIGYAGTDETIKAMYTAFVKRLRYDEGRKITCVLCDYTTADDIGIISVKNGVKLSDGTVIAKDKAVAWVTGATAGAEVNQSLTNTAYDGAVDADTKYTQAQLETAIKAGEFVFYSDSGRARALADINTLTDITSDKTDDWTSNRVIRVLDGWGNDVARIFADRYIGKVTNSSIGRQLFKADLVKLAVQYQDIDAISDFDSADIVVTQGNGKRDVAVETALVPNDSMEKLYMKVIVS